MDKKRCPACTIDIDPEIIREVNNFTLNRCPTCGLIFSDPMKNPGAEWYKSLFRKSALNFVYDGLGWYHKQFLEDKMNYGLRLLDIGCGTGIFLDSARKKGYKVYGIDINREVVDIAKERYNLKEVYAIDEEEFCDNFTYEKFDVITFFEVMEHLNNPAQFVGRVKKMLKPRGYVVLSVPNNDRVLEAIDCDIPPHHLTKWSKSCLSNFLKKNEFEIIRFIARRIDIDDITAYLMSKIDLGIARKLGEHYMETRRQNYAKRAAILIKIKYLIFKLLSFICMPFLTLFYIEEIEGIRGLNLYVVARSK